MRGGKVRLIELSFRLPLWQNSERKKLATNVTKQVESVERRRQQSAIVGRLMVAGFVAMRSGYPRKNIGAVFEELLVSMAIRINDDAGGNPTTVADLAKLLGLPDSNVRRYTKALIEEGVIRKVDRGFQGDMDYLAARVDADYFKALTDAIIKAGDELRALG
jgi:hypothetical protein